MIKMNKLTPNFGATEFEVISKSGSELQIQDEEGRVYRRNTAHAKVVPMDVDTEREEEKEEEGATDKQAVVGSNNENMKQRQKPALSTRVLPKRNAKRPERYQ